MLTTMSAATRTAMEAHVARLDRRDSNSMMYTKTELKSMTYCESVRKIVIGG